MDLFPKSSKNIFRRKIPIKDSEIDLEKFESQNAKWKLQNLESAMTKRSTDNETALEHEMEETLSQVNGFLHRLKLAELVHSKKKKGNMRDWSKQQAFERLYSEQVGLGHMLMTKVQDLLELEYSGMRASKSSRSMINMGHTQGEVGKQSDSNLSQCSRYSSEIREVLHKFGDVLKIKSVEGPTNLQGSYNPYNVKISVRGDRDSSQLLTELLARDSIQPVFRSLPQIGSSTHTAACSVFNMNVEGRGPERTTAKKAAATKMLEKLLEDNAKKCLPPQITPFTQSQMQEAVAVLCATEAYDEALAQACADWRKPPPHYDVSSGRPRTRATCTALGLSAHGVHHDSTVAKRMAAREVLLKFKQKPKY